MATFPIFHHLKGKKTPSYKFSPFSLSLVLGMLFMAFSHFSYATDVGGRVYCDKNGSNSYTSGEELTVVEVKVYNNTTNALLGTVYTNSSGIYNLNPVANGTPVRVELTYNGIKYTKTGTSPLTNLNVQVTCAVNCDCPNNALTNGSFEGNVDGWNFSGGNFYSGTGYQVCGNNNAYLEENTANNNARFWQDVSITPGSTVSLSVWAGTHRPDLDHRIKLKFYDAADQPLSGGSEVQIDKDVDVGPTPLTQQYFLTGTAPAGTAYVQVEGTANGDYIKVDLACLTITCPTVTNPNPVSLKTICEGGTVSFSASTTARSPVTIEWVRFNTAVTNPYTATGNGKTILGSGTISGGSASLSSTNFPAVNGQSKTYYVYACLKGATDNCQPFVSYQVEVLKPSVSATGGVLKCDPATLQISSVGSPASGTYSWTGPSSFTSALQNPSVSVGGTYTVTYSITKGGVTCTASDTAKVSTSTTKPTIAVNGGVLTCTTTSLQLSPTTSPVNGLTYVWSGPSVPANTTTKNYTTSVGGTFTVTATNPANGCTASDTAIVSVNTTKPSITVNGGVLTCTKTSLQLAPTTNPVNGLTYVWSGPSVPANTTTKNYTTSVVGTFTVTATNPANGCTASDTAIVSTNTTKPTITVNGGVLTCTTTSLQLAPTTTPASGLTYVWSGPSVPANTTTKNYTTSVVGTFTVTATNPANGCTASDTAIVSTNTTKPTIAVNGGVLTCTKTSLQLAPTTNPVNGLTYVWSGPSVPANTTTKNYTTSVGGTFTVTAKNPANGCTASDTAIVSINTTKPSITVNGGVLTCTKTSLQLAPITNPTSGLTYVWSGPSVPANTTTKNYTTSVIGTFTVTATNPANGCTASDTAIVSQNKTVPTVTVSGGELTCSTLNLQLTANASSNVTYLWSGTGVTGQTSQSVTVSSEGVYQVTVTNKASGCTASDTAVVTKDINRPVVVANGGAITCLKSSVTITAEAAPPGVTFAWTGPASFTSTQPSITVQQAGVYNVIVTNPNNGCTASDTAIVIEDKTIPNVNAGLDKVLTCETTSVQLDGSSSTPGATFSWVGPVGATFDPSATDASPIVTVAGTYTLTVTGPNGCKATDEVIVTEDKTKPTVSVTGGVLTCEKNSLTLTANASNGVTYLWSGTGVNGLTTQSVSASAVGVYTVTVTNTANGCTASDTAIVSENIVKPTVELNTVKLTCASPSQTLTATVTNGGTPSLVWTVPSGVTNPGNVASFAVTTPGEYAVLVTNGANGCSNSAKTEVTQDTLKPSVSLNDITLTCASPSQTLTATVTNGGANPTYVWTVPNGVTNPGNVADFAITKTGTYSVEVTNLTNGCKALATTLVEADTAKVNVTLNTTKLACASPDQILTATVTNGGANPSYVWTVPNGVTNPGNVPSFSVDAVGNYSVNVTNVANGCIASANTTVTADTAKVTVSLNPITLTCTQLSQTLTATITNGGTTPTYSWTVPSGVTNPGNVSSFTVTKVGFYSIEVTNTSSGCKGVATSLVKADTAAVKATLQPITLTCASPSKTLKVAVLNGGATPTYAWTVPNGVTNPGNKDSLVVSVAGTYSVLVTNPANGCSGSATTTVTLDTAKVSVTLNPITLTCELPSQQLTATVVNGGNSPTYVWTVPIGATNPGNNPVATVTIAGLYSVEVTNTLNGCKGIVSETVKSDTNRVTVELNSINLTCATPTGTLTATVKNGGANPKYVWQVPQGVTNPGNVPSFTVSVAGTYSVEVTNQLNGCKGMANITVSADTSKPILEISERSCAVDLKFYSVKVISNGTITTTPPYTVTSNGGGLFTISGVPAGQSVLVTATSASSNCKTTLEVAAPDCNCPTIEPPIGSSRAFCEGDTASKLTVVVGTGETADWYDAESGGTKLAENTLSFKPTKSGTYWAQARKIDGSNCISLRVPLTLTINPTPTLLVSQQPKCSENRQTYSFKVTSNGTVTSTLGQVTDNLDGTFTVSGVAINQDAVITATSDKTCEAKITVKAPNCECPPAKCVPYTVVKKKATTTAQDIGGK